MYWTGKKVLVTGAGGFIGSHLVEGLVRAGAQVRAFVRYNSRSSYGMIELLDPGIIRELDMYAGDLRDSDAVERSLLGTEVVLHLGAVIPIPYSYVHPREVAETNILGTLNLLQAARSAALEKIVITDQLDNETELSFQQVKTNIDLPDDEFVFVAPAGTQVVEGM